MGLIDENGNVLGTVNVVDAFVLLCVVGLLGLSVVFVAGTGTAPSKSAAPTSNASVATDRANVTLEVDSMDPVVAQAIEPGATERSGGKTIARVTEVERDNATMIVTASNGTVYRRDHPTNRRVTLSADLAVRKTDTKTLFKGERLRTGQTLSLTLDGIGISARVVETGVRNP